MSTLSIPDINTSNKTTSLPDSTPQTEKSTIKGLAWAATTIAAAGGTLGVGVVFASLGASGLAWTVLSIADGDFVDAFLGASMCGVAALGAKVTLATLPYFNHCLNNACYHLR